MDLSADLPLQDARLDASLQQVVGAQRTRLAAIETLELGDLAKDQTVAVDAVVTVQVASVPYVDGSDLVLHLEVTTPRPTYLAARELPLLEPGGSLRLPLLEYNDPLPEGIAGALDVDLTAQTTQRSANPGDVVVFEAHLRNDGEATRTVRTELQGAARAAAHLATDRVRLGPGDEATLRFQVQVPEAAQQNDLLEVVLVAAHGDEAALASLLRFAVVVDEREEHPSDAPLVAGEAGRDSPTPPAGFVVSVLVGLALVRARRR